MSFWTIATYVLYIVAMINVVFCIYNWGYLRGLKWSRNHWHEAIRAYTNYIAELQSELHRIKSLAGGELNELRNKINEATIIRPANKNDSKPNRSGSGLKVVELKPATKYEE